MLEFKGTYFVKVIREGKVIDEFEVENLVTIEGKNYLLQLGFGIIQDSSQFFVGLIGNSVTIQQTDTASACLGPSGTYGEITNYSESTRPAFSVNFTDNAISNATTPVSFTFSGNATIYGLFLCSSNEKGSNEGILFSAVRFPSVKSFSANDILNVIYSISSVVA